MYLMISLSQYFLFFIGYYLPFINDDGGFIINDLPCTDDINFAKGTLETEVTEYCKFISKLF